MGMKGCLTLPRNEDTFWFDTAVALMKGKEQEILVEKGDRQILDVIKDAKEARDKKWKEKGDIEKIPDRVNTIRCAKCGVERPETEYDCHTINCNYGGD